MTPLEQTAEYKRGRNGEILIHSFAIEHGCTTFDIGGTARGAAPVLGHRKGNIIAPDALHFRNYPAWAEYKTKSNAWRRRNPIFDAAGNRIPPFLGHGIERRHFAAYRDANRLMPVTLWFLTVNTGQLHVASLDELGEPFGSENPVDYDMVNWPLGRMFRVATFHPKRLRAFFNSPRRHAGLPSETERKELLDYLRPVQLELPGFIEHFLTWREREWKPA